MTPGAPTPAPYDGLLLVDKPSGWTSHDVVARIRRLAGTRRVGHAGTLDPMATGVLIVGVGRATRLLGHLARTDKAYDATVRLGQSTVTDDAEGDVVGGAPAGGVSVPGVRAALSVLIGDIDQVPSSVSAVKVDGVRSYVRARAGEDVRLPARRVTVSRLDLVGIRRVSPSDGELVDLDIRVVCSSGTYVRAIARDLGAALAVGGHLVALRRTRVGPYDAGQSHTLEALGVLADHGELGAGLLPLAAAVATAFPRRDVDADTARLVGHGRPLEPVALGPGPVGVFGPDGSVLALVEDRDGLARPLVVFAPVP